MRELQRSLKTTMRFIIGRFMAEILIAKIMHAARVLTHLYPTIPIAHVASIVKLACNWVATCTLGSRMYLNMQSQLKTRFYCFMSPNLSEDRQIHRIRFSA